MLSRESIVARYEVPDRTAPHLRVNFIASVDGAASHDGVSGPLNNEDDKKVFGILRMLADVVLVGAGTVREEGYGPMVLGRRAVAWRLENGLPEHPRFAIVSGRLDLDPASPIFTDAPVRPLVITQGSAEDDSGDDAGRAGVSVDRRVRLAALAEVADMIECGTGRLDPRAMVDALVARGLPQILSEGGPALLGALIEADAVDELCLTLAPVLEGGDATRITRGGAQTTREMRLAHAFHSGDMLFLRYLRAR